jgi:DNA mismatch repair protein MutL
MSEEPAATPDIHALDRDTIQRIAAGEVVERPASVVKELVENALDADANRVSVAVDAGGTEGIRVRDDGVGMTAEGLEIAVEEHTTSKIRDIDDLEAGVGTLGFRGEALSTIGAVSRLTVRSRPRNGADSGHELTVEGGEVGEVKPAGCPEGTTVEVEDLFFNTPARKKFLKTEATEFDHVNTVVTQYALANPGVAISLEHNGREVFATQGDGDLRSAVLSVYGREVAEAMVDVEDPDPEGPVDAVRGLVSHPETTRSSRDYLATFVNGRYVTSGVLREAVLSAYGGQLATDRYPFAVLFVEVPADEVDVNVHPRKMEVRFDHEPGVRAAVESAVESALLDHGLVRSTAPRGRSRAAQTEISPETPEEEAVGGAGTAHEEESGADADEPRRRESTERPETTALGGDAEGDDGDRGGVSDDTDGIGAYEEDGAVADDSEADPHDDPGATDQESGPSRPSPRAWQSTETEAVDDGAGGAEEGRSSVSPGLSPGLDDEDDAGATETAGAATDPPETTNEDGTATPDESPPSDPTAGAESTGLEFEAPTDQRTLAGGEATVDVDFDTLPRLRVLGQLDDTYIVAETADGMVLVDQHAADERVNYERLQAELAGDAPVQALADPVDIELTAREAALFEEHREALTSIGFRAERTGERTVAVRSVPAVFDATLDPDLLRDVLTAFVEDEAEGGQATVDAVADSLLADLACYPSITGNTSLREGSVADLLSALDDCENPYACPHGRPVLVRFDREEIEDRFERDYPGHGGRREA